MVGIPKRHSDFLSLSLILYISISLIPSVPKQEPPPPPPPPSALLTSAWAPPRGLAHLSQKTANGVLAVLHDESLGESMGGG